SPPPVRAAGSRSPAATPCRAISRSWKRPTSPWQSHPPPGHRSPSRRAAAAGSCSTRTREEPPARRGSGQDLLGAGDGLDGERGLDHAQAAGGVEGGGGRKAQDEFGALADAALDLDRAAVALDDPLRDRQAEAGALGLRGVEGDEDAVQRVLGDAA